MSKKALLVGINNFVPGIPPLRGCVNDTQNMRALLQSRFGFAPEDIKVLNDADAKWTNIKDHLENWLIAGSTAGDVRIFHFSSHGTQVADQPGGDEPDGADEVVVPYDHDWDKPVRDDMLKAILDKAPAGVNLTVLMDCCHSGTGTRPLNARYIDPPVDIQRAIEVLRRQREAQISAQGTTELVQALRNLPQDQWANILVEKIGQSVKRKDAISPQAASDLAQTLQKTPSDQWASVLADKIRELLQRKRQNRYGVVDTREKAILLAACRDRQTAADSYIEGTYQGAFTFGLIRSVIDLGANLTYDQLFRTTTNNIKKFAKSDQDAQLECPDKLRSQKIFQPLTV